jgi:hypothetical protein
MDAWIMSLRQIMESLLHNDPFTFHAVRGKLMFLCVDIVHRPNVERAITDPREIQMFAIASGGLQCLRFIGYSNVGVLISSSLFQCSN